MARLPQAKSSIEASASQFMNYVKNLGAARLQFQKKHSQGNPDAKKRAQREREREREREKKKREREREQKERSRAMITRENERWGSFPPSSMRPGNCIGGAGGAANTKQ